MLWMYVSSLKNTILNGSYSCLLMDVYTPEITQSLYLSNECTYRNKQIRQKVLLLRKVPWHQVGIYRERSWKKNDWVPTVILERKRKIKTTESQNDSQITENSQIETESLSDLNVQRQYYYCKSDNETLLNASQKIWEFENLKNCFRITHKVLGCVLNVCELTKIPHCLPMDD